MTTEQQNAELQAAIANAVQTLRRLWHRILQALADLIRALAPVVRAVARIAAQYQAARRARLRTIHTAYRRRRAA